VIGVLLVVAVSGARIVRQDVGHVGVVRNGGPLDNRGIRQIIQPASGPMWAGWFSQSPHEYPASRVTRTYTVTADPTRGARLGADLVTVPTKDGVQIGLEGTVFYHFTGERDSAVLTRFDSTIGTHLFHADGGGTLRAWQGDDGWNAMVETLFRPILENNLRRELGKFQCAELVPSCNLLHRVSNTKQSDTGQNIAAIERSINKSLETDLTGTLGLPYFWDLKFTIAGVTLPKNVQGAINDAQASYAGVADAKAKARQARYQNRRNSLLAKTYEKSPALANIEALKAIPKGSTVIMSPGNGKSPQVLAGAGN
jgi:regulator of protease activity HflC (stomatin/prohibitin superfamily)